MWTKLDDRITEHPKLAQVGALGFAWQTAALVYCNRNLTDGFVPYGIARQLLPLKHEDLEGRIYSIGLNCGMSGRDGEDLAELLIDSLLDAGIWEPVDGGYMIHDFHEYQPTKAEVLAARKREEERYSSGGVQRATRAERDGAGRFLPSQTDSEEHFRRSDQPSPSDSPSVSDGPAGVPVVESSPASVSPSVEPASSQRSSVLPSVYPASYPASIQRSSSPGPGPGPGPEPNPEDQSQHLAADAAENGSAWWFEDRWRVTDDQRHFLNRLHDLGGWDELTGKGLQKLRTEYGDAVVTTALGHGCEEQLRLVHPYPWLRATCDSIRSQSQGVA